MKFQLAFVFAFMFLISSASALTLGQTYFNGSTGEWFKVVNQYPQVTTNYVCQNVPVEGGACVYPTIDVYDEAGCGCALYLPTGSCQGYYPKEERPECYFPVEDTTQACVPETTEVCENVESTKIIDVRQSLGNIQSLNGESVFSVPILNVSIIETNTVLPDDRLTLPQVKSYFDILNLKSKTTHYAKTIRGTLSLENRTAMSETAISWLFRITDTQSSDISKLQTENAQLKANLTNQTNRINAVRNCGNYANVTSVTTLKNCLRVI